MDHTGIYILTAVLFALFYTLGYLMGGRHEQEKASKVKKSSGSSRKQRNLESGNASAISSLSAHTTAQGVEIQSITTQVVSHQARLKNLESRMDAYDAKADKLESYVTPISGGIKSQASGNMTLLNCNAETFDSGMDQRQTPVGYVPTRDQTGLGQINSR